MNDVMQLVVVSDVTRAVRMVTMMSNTRLRVFLVESFIVEDPPPGPASPPAPPPRGRGEKGGVAAQRMIEYHCQAAFSVLDECKTGLSLSKQSVKST